MFAKNTPINPKTDFKGFKNLTLQWQSIRSHAQEISHTEAKVKKFLLKGGLRLRKEYLNPKNPFFFFS